MKYLVIYGSRTGNTRTVAEAIGRGLGLSSDTWIVEVEDAPTSFGREVELVVIGSATEQHGVYAPMRHWLDELAPDALIGKAVAAFDTRLWWPRLLSGSASTTIASEAADHGGHLILAPQSFIVSMKPALEPGEEQRAEGWGGTLRRALAGVSVSAT